MAKLELDNTQTIFRQVYEHLHGKICSFEFKPFEKLSDKLISEELSVSRTPVRDALARLAENNLVDIIPQRGTRVSPLRRADLEKSQFLREALEISLLRRAISSPDRRELVEKMRREIILQKAYIETSNLDKLYASDNEFHGLIAGMSGVPSILGEIKRARIQMDRFRMLMVSGVDDMSVIVEQHTQITDAVEIGDLELAEKRMLNHLRRILEYVDEAMARFPEYFEDQPSGIPVSNRKTA